MDASAGTMTREMTLDSGRLEDIGVAMNTGVRHDLWVAEPYRLAPIAHAGDPRGRMPSLGGKRD
jgi:hypothetical protein